MFVVVVFLEVKPSRLEAFREAMLRHARRSMELEPGCMQFDVCEDPELAGSYLLYEVYSDEAAYEAHRQSQHYGEQTELIKDWVLSRKRLTYKMISQIASPTMRPS